jgi:hypothetical protein
MVLLTVITLILSSLSCSSTPINQELKIVIEEPNINEVWVQEIGNIEGDYSSGFGISSNIASRAIGIHNGELYIGTQNIDSSKLRPNNLNFWLKVGLYYYRLSVLLGISTFFRGWGDLGFLLHGMYSDGCEVWKYNYTQDEWSPIVSDAMGHTIPAGFGNHRTFAAAIIKSFKGKLYVGTAASALTGCEIWRWDEIKWQKVVENGFNDRFNTGAWSVTEFNDELYIGTMNWRNGCQIWKTNNGDSWQKVSLPGGDGFGTKWNIYAWSMEVYNQSLYIGTCNLNLNEGCQLWRYDGNQWFKVDLPGGDGFGEKENYGIRNIVEYNHSLYVGVTANILQQNEACEIWKYNGEDWHSIVGEESNLGDGFGKLYNKYPWSMIVTSDNYLWIGTLNEQPLTDKSPITTNGCEIWRYDGDQWEEIIGENGSELKGGFGNKYNVGARSMIEYPRNSGIIWIGTGNFDVSDFSIFKGCEIWKRG